MKKYLFFLTFFTVIGFFMTDSAHADKLLDIPPLPYAQSDYCGEVCIQEALVFLGKYVSQSDINRAGGGNGVVGLWSEDVVAALRNLNAVFDSWWLESPDYDRYIEMIKGKIDSNYPVLIGVKINPTSHPNWICDHFVLVVGYTADSFIFNDPSARRTRTFLEFKNGDAGSGSGYTITNPFGTFFGVSFEGLKADGDGNRSDGDGGGGCNTGVWGLLAALPLFLPRSRPRGEKKAG
jgi:hypothetical protein